MLRFSHRGVYVWLEISVHFNRVNSEHLSTNINTWAYFLKTYCPALHYIQLRYVVR